MHEPKLSHFSYHSQGAEATDFIPSIKHVGMKWMKLNLQAAIRQRLGSTGLGMGLGLGLTRAWLGWAGLIGDITNNNKNRNFPLFF